MSERKRGEVERREQEILAGAMALFNRDDWPSVSMDQIAHAADVSKGTLYNHFASKDDIYARLLIDFSGQVLGQLEALDAGAPAAKTRRILAILWNAYRDNPNYRRIAYYCEREGFRRDLAPSVSAELAALDQRFATLTAAVLQKGVESGRFRQAPVLDLQMSVRFVLAGMSRVVWSSPVAAAPDDPMFRLLCDFVLAGLGAHGA